MSLLEIGLHGRKIAPVLSLEKASPSVSVGQLARRDHLSGAVRERCIHGRGLISATSGSGDTCLGGSSVVLLPSTLGRPLDGSEPGFDHLALPNTRNGADLGRTILVVCSVKTLVISAQQVETSVCTGPSAEVPMRYCQNSRSKSSRSRINAAER